MVTGISIAYAAPEVYNKSFPKPIVSATSIIAPGVKPSA